MQIQDDPKRGETLNQIEAHALEIETSGERNVNGVITIPVVVHVLYNNGAENISDAQILSQIQVLNDDFRRFNADADDTWSQAADSEIEFCMATSDPNGVPTNGILRVPTSVSAFGTNDDMKFTSSGGSDAWPASDYLNMWVCDISGGILGYAQFPGGSSATDGVVCDYQYFGTVGAATAPFDGGRTTTHEVGHWLNLRHIWGDGNCNADDFVADTPGSDGPNYGCAVGTVSCSSTDMVQNYMDYSDDACMNLYTVGQRNRMRALFESGGYRASLLASQACGEVVAPTCDDGIQNGGETGIDCGGPSCEPCVCHGVEVTVTLNFDNYPEETSWQISDGTGVVASGGTYPTAPDGSTLTIVECMPEACYTFTIFDSYGDGICCGYGSGSYTVTDEFGNELASGASFGSSEATAFCVSGPTEPTCDDGIQNGDETGVDCGGSCAACATCDDGLQNGDETGIDCGGSCTACATCDDGIQNGDETGVDCGGSCAACATCDDGIQNGDETGIDCGGSCTACATCDDGLQNGDETGVDCGGSCTPCGCNGVEVTVTIGLDNYPEETSWEITGSSGAVASGGTYPSAPDGSTVTATECLSDGCYTFTIFDSYGDGLCCSYGSGSYSVEEASGTTYASGTSFGSSESTNFCVSSTGPQPTCDDGLQNGDETGIDCGGSCAACATCDDGLQNGDETGIDCGGSCAACATCDDGLQNGDETGIDCGGSCAACATCDDGLQNGDETGIDCGGSCAACATCDDGLQNGDETGIDCGGSCAACATCDDGLQNGDETGIDCGGSCAPCETGPCSYGVINSANFEGGFGIWNDGGSDCRRSRNDRAYANGTFCVRIRDNTSSSRTYTDPLDLTGYEELTVNFRYITSSMENGKEFWLRISTNGGASFTTVETYVSGVDFTNETVFNSEVVIPGPFSSSTVVQLQCNAGNNGDRVHLDDIEISGCVVGGRWSDAVPVWDQSNAAQYNPFQQLNLYPNPADDAVQLAFYLDVDGSYEIGVVDLLGRQLLYEQRTQTAGEQLFKIPTADWSEGTYILYLRSKDGAASRRFIIQR